MIVYRKTFLGLHLLFRAYGSAILRTAVWGIVAAAQTVLLYVLRQDHLTRYFTEGGHVMAYTVFSGLMSLLVIFRQNAGYGRFHEGRTRLQAMSGAWLDGCIKALSFDGGSKSFGPPDQASLRFRLDCVHMFSLMHGLAMQFLRSDWQLENLAEHDETKLPPWDSGNSPSYSPALIDYFMLRSMSSVRLPYNAAHPIPVVGRLSPQEEAMLSMQQAKRTRTLGSDDWEDAQRRPGPLQLARHHLFTNSQGKYNRGAAERIYQAYYWCHERCRQRMAEGGLDMPAPILASLYASLQKGMESFEHCRYLCDTPFPFCWAQLLVVMLLCFQFTLPFIIVTSIKDWALGIVFAVISVQAYWTLNEVSRELEDPFCFPPNDIPLARLQYQFNERILTAANTRLPGSCMDGTYEAQLEEVVCKAAGGSLAAPDAGMSSDAELPAEGGDLAVDGKLPARVEAKQVELSV